MRLWLAMLGLGGSLVGQSTARIEGRVVSQSGEPIRKATVQLRGGQPPTTYVEVSDNAGKFAIDGLAPGRYTISASRAGFAAARAIASITLQAGQARTDLEIKLVQLGFISGQVADQDGDPVFGANIEAMRPQYVGTQRQWISRVPVVSDERGNFRILNVDQGRYYVMALSPNAQGFLATDRLSRSAQQVDVTTFYPSASGFSAAVGIQVGAGQDVQGINIRMVRARLFSIAGKAVDRNGAPSEMQLSLTRKGTEAFLLGNHGLDSRPTTGAFEVHGLQTGTYILKGRPRQMNVPANALASYAGHQEITISDSDVDGIVFSLPDPLEITGTVRVESGDLKDILPAPCPPAGCPRGTVGPSIGLVDLDESFGMSPSGELEPGGTFKISNISWSRYTVMPRGFSGNDLYLKSMRFGGQDAIKNPLDLTSGVGGVLELLYSHRAAEVDASVRGEDGKVVTNVSVSLWPKTPLAFDPFRGQMFRTNQEHIEITNVPPGEYYVAAWDSVDSDLLSNPEFLARFVSEATSVKVGESDKVSVDLMPIPKDKIAAKVAKLP